MNLFIETRPQTTYLRAVPSRGGTVECERYLQDPGQHPKEHQTQQAKQHTLVNLLHGQRPALAARARGSCNRKELRAITLRHPETPSTTHVNARCASTISDGFTSINISCLRVFYYDKHPFPFVYLENGERNSKSTLLSTGTRRRLSAIANCRTQQSTRQIA